MNNSESYASIQTVGQRVVCMDKRNFNGTHQGLIGTKRATSLLGRV